MGLAYPLQDEFATVEELQDALVAPDMYLKTALYHTLCVGMESGRLRGMTPISQHKGLPDMLSIAYEAHFRTELHACISVAGYRHSYSKEATHERAQFFKKIIAVVKMDRANNTATAWTNRVQYLRDAGITSEDNPHEDATEHGGVDFDDDMF